MALRNILNYTKKEILNDFKISRADAVRSAMDSLILEGFTFTREEEKLLIEMTDIAKYINNKLVKLKKKNLKFSQMKNKGVDCFET